MLWLLVARSAVGVAAEPLADMVVIPAGAFFMGATPDDQQAVLAFGWQDPMRNRIQ